MILTKRLLKSLSYAFATRFQTPPIILATLYIPKHRPTGMQGSQ